MTAEDKGPANKSPRSEREEKILAFWEENKIFEKTLEKDSPKGDFIFYEGPPTANGKPGIHHLEARAFKDAIPRYKTMQGYKVRRKASWDTHQTHQPRRLTSYCDKLKLVDDWRFCSCL